MLCRRAGHARLRHAPATSGTAWQEFTGHRLCLDLPPDRWLRTPAVAAGTTSASLAYVIHTSGSTGVPKGALNTHGGIRNKLLWMQATYQLTPYDRVLQQTPVTFDISVLEIFWPLIAGARLVIANPRAIRTPQYLVRTIAERSVTQRSFRAIDVALVPRRVR